jgi:hypothetical protein
MAVVVWVATAEVDSRDGIGVGGEEVTAVSVFWRWTWRGVERMGQKWEKRGGAMWGGWRQGSERRHRLPIVDR